MHTLDSMVKGNVRRFWGKGVKDEEEGGERTHSFCSRQLMFTHPTDAPFIGVAAARTLSSALFTGAGSSSSPPSCSSTGRPRPSAATPAKTPASVAHKDAPARTLAWESEGYAGGIFSVTKCVSQRGGQISLRPPLHGVHAREDLPPRDLSTVCAAERSTPCSLPPTFLILASFG